MYQIENIEKGIHFLFSRENNWRKQGEHLPKIGRFISCHLQRQKCEEVAKWVIAEKIEVIIIVYIAKRSYAENA